jgi:hypothetical protein
MNTYIHTYAHKCIACVKYIHVNIYIYIHIYIYILVCAKIYRETKDTSPLVGAQQVVSGPLGAPGTVLLVTKSNTLSGPCMFVFLVHLACRGYPVDW